MNSLHAKPAVIITITILILLTFGAIPSTQSQSPVTLTTQDQFTIPSLNGIIDFSENGSFTTATLENNSWKFQDLRIGNSGNLTISAQDSNITIYLFRSNNTFLRSSILRYNAEGLGIQRINLGLSPSQTTSVSEWSVIVEDNIFLAPGDGWELQKDNTIIVTNEIGNVTVVHYSFESSKSNLPFYQQHSVAIITAVFLSITVFAAFLVRMKERG